MSAILYDRRVDAEGSDATAASPVVITGPDGAEYDISLPDGATPAEVAAIAASVSAALSTQVEDDHSTDGSAFDAWHWRGRLESTGRHPSLDGSADDPWKYSGRPSLF